MGLRTIWSQIRGGGNEYESRSKDIKFKKENNNDKINKASKTGNNTVWSNTQLLKLACDPI